MFNSRNIYYLCSTYYLYLYEIKNINQPLLVALIPQGTGDRSSNCGCIYFYNMIKICKWCGEVFETNTLQKRYCGDDCCSLSVSNKTKIRISKKYREPPKNKEDYYKYIMYLFSRIRSAAKRKNKDFNLTPNDIKIPDFCPYLEIPIKKEIIKNGIGQKRDNSPSIDRIDNSKGYIKGNVQVISNKANVIKSNLTIPELILFAENILKLHKK